MRCHMFKLLHVLSNSCYIVGLCCVFVIPYVYSCFKFILFRVGVVRVLRSGVRAWLIHPSRFLTCSLFPCI